MAGDSPGVEYRCPECGSEDVEAYEYEDESRIISECVHIYCQAADCGWMHRGLMRDGEMVRNA